MMRRSVVWQRAGLLIAGLCLALGAWLVPVRAWETEDGAQASAPESTITTAAGAPRPTTTIAGLVKADARLDRQEVAFSGEVVGDIINAEGGNHWLTLEDGGASISVYVVAEDAEKVTHLGRYNQRGTRLLVVGVFERDCEAHDGLLDVHARRVQVLDPGSTSTSAFSESELQLAVLLIVLAAGLFFLHWRLRERSR